MAHSATAVQVGTAIETLIDRIDLDGTGVGQLAGLEVHVARTLPGDRVRARVTGVSRQWPRLFAELLEVTAPAPGRRASPCPANGSCDGCALIELDDAAQALAKLQLLRRELAARVPPALLPDRIVATPPALGYRRRAKYVVAIQGGVVRLGAFARRSHGFVATDPCPVVAPAIALALPAVAAALQEHGVVVADKGRPGLRYLQVRSNGSGELLLTLVAHAPTRELRQAAPDILRNVPSAVGVTLDINPGAGDAILGGRGEVLAGRGELADTLAGVAVVLGPYDFVQLHGPAGDRLAERVAGHVAAAGGGPIIDLFSGVGTLAFAMARSGRATIAVERVPSAVRAGRSASRAAGLAVEHVLADGARFLAGLSARGKVPAALVVDPPRRGLGADAVSDLAATGVPLLVYVSCWPRALARDLDALHAGGFGVVAVEAHDLFPQTPTVEVLAVLAR